MLSIGFTLFALGGAKLVSDLVGFVYPAYASFKAIDSDDPNDDTQWLTYWVVFACSSIVETAANFLISWIPFYVSTSSWCGIHACVRINSIQFNSFAHPPHPARHLSLSVLHQACVPYLALPPLYPWCRRCLRKGYPPIYSPLRRIRRRRIVQQEVQLIR